MSAHSDHSIILIRHGATEWSRDGRHTGTTDLPLLPDGEADARKLREQVAELDVVATFCSPLQRARRTAELAGLTDVRIDYDLREWDYGGYEGMSTPQIREKLGDPSWEIFADGVVPGATPGETVEDVAARVSHVVRKVVPLMDHGNVALVAHGHSLRIFAAIFLRQPPRMGAQLMLNAASLSKLGFYHGTPCIQVWNEGGDFA
ncbi:histidine phosphatase family protein [Rudaeicoccus suwonensis]|uniref:Putative phosphoglycerate mutase n=1 Tax=Rudaeicoccus suwonensis TaxID=657409 RepID=A0A561EB56_9MICO|nr:histidine phosphatase family protein [Rudaeicoccus suwonensis]TWE12840.1 putative phosphoglycerate mutase [Rudaeicoccus suwonensis]